MCVWRIWSSSILVFLLFILQSCQGRAPSEANVPSNTLKLGEQATELPFEFSFEPLLKIPDISVAKVMDFRRQVVRRQEDLLAGPYEPSSDVFGGMNDSFRWRTMAEHTRLPLLSKASVATTIALHPFALIVPIIKVQTGKEAPEGTVLQYRPVRFEPKNRVLYITAIVPESMRYTLENYCLELWFQNAYDFGFRSAAVYDPSSVMLSKAELVPGLIADLLADTVTQENGPDSFSSRFRCIAIKSLPAKMKVNLWKNREVKADEVALFVVALTIEIS